jgi:aerobic-type carbon monoxide dehydrogenase small subunit (CoxS/CutS family)
LADVKPTFDSSLLNFASILSTENGTKSNYLIFLMEQYCNGTVISICNIVYLNKMKVTCWQWINPQTQHLQTVQNDWCSGSNRQTGCCNSGSFWHSTMLIMATNREILVLIKSRRKLGKNIFFAKVQTDEIERVH